MSQFYTDPSRESDAYSLPNAEVFWAEAGEWGYDIYGERVDADEANFRGCYRGPASPNPWHASNLLIDNRDPVANADDHAGVYLIRGYYPEFTPTAEHFASAKWGA